MSHLLPAGFVLAQFLLDPSVKIQRRAPDETENMRAAIATLEGRVAPLLDTASHFTLLDIASGTTLASVEAHLTAPSPATRLKELAERGVEVLVCGAASRHVQGLASVFGIRLVPFVTGDVRRVAAALAARGLDRPEFAVPGRRGGRRRRRRCRRGRGPWGGPTGF